MSDDLRIREKDNVQRRYYVLSTCGIALLTSTAGSLGIRSLVIKYANHKYRPDDPEGAELEQLLDKAAQQLSEAEPHIAGTLSAELNALVKLYDGQFSRPQDYHVLLSTDTWLGERAANLVQDWLIGQGLASVTVRRQSDLQTSDIEAFQVALSDIVRFCEREVSGFRQDGYHIIFNLTGGFKSVQGFLQILATFYADESIYVFESGTSLLRLPRLPIEMSVDKELLKNLRVIRRLAANLPVEPEEIERIPETLRMIVDDTAALSPWGDLVWEQSKKKIFREQLYPPPSTLLKYGAAFQASLRRQPPEFIYLINERIMDLAVCLETRHNPRSLDFKPLQGDPCPPSTHEADVWSGKRLFGHFEGKVFVLDRMGDHLN